MIFAWQAMTAAAGRMLVAIPVVVVPKIAARRSFSAVQVPWETAVNEDGTFKAPDELRALYRERGVTSDREVVPYCTVGGRSGHTWFALSQLAGYPNVRLYEAPWAEWGQTPGLPVE